MVGDQAGVWVQVVYHHGVYERRIKGSDHESKDADKDLTCFYYRFLAFFLVGGLKEISVDVKLRDNHQRKENGFKEIPPLDPAEAIWLNFPYDLIHISTYKEVKSNASEKKGVASDQRGLCIF
jgi:hypothetical protein